MTKKRRVLFITFFALTLLWAGVIFNLSATEGEQSLEQSNAVVKLIGEISPAGDGQDKKENKNEKEEDKSLEQKDLETGKDKLMPQQTQQETNNVASEAPKQSSDTQDNKQTPPKKSFVLKKNTSKLTEAEEKREERIKESIEKNENIPMFSALNSIARKLAHISSYVLLAFLAYFAVCFLSAFPNRIEGVPWVSVTACILFACTDEYHQSFVHGRSGRISDVIVDSFGVLVGTLAAFWIARGLAKMKQRKKKSSDKQQ